MIAQDRETLFNTVFALPSWTVYTYVHIITHTKTTNVVSHKTTTHNNKKQKRRRERERETKNHHNHNTHTSTPPPHHHTHTHTLHTTHTLQHIPAYTSIYNLYSILYTLHTVYKVYTSITQGEKSASDRKTCVGCVTQERRRTSRLLTEFEKKKKNYFSQRSRIIINYLLTKESSNHAFTKSIIK